MTTEHSPNAVALEVTSALLVPAAAFGFIRVFAEAGAVVPILVAAVLSTALATLLRRANVPLVVAAVVSFLGLCELTIQRYAPTTTRWVVFPTGETRRVLGLLLDDGLLQFRELKAPVDTLPPFVAAAIGGVWLLAFLTDWAALRLRLAFEPVLPAGLLFIFTSVLGSGVHQITSTFVFAAAVALWAVVQRAHSLSQGVWLTVDRRRGPASVLRAAGALSVSAVLVGLAVGPRLPGAGEPELYEWRSFDDPTRQVISPYVSVRNRLASQQDDEMFTVVSERRSYWRLAGLDIYRDDFWSTRGNFEAEGGDLPGSLPNAGTTETIEQTFSITGLSEIWLPAAYAPSRILESESTITWNAEISSLTVDNSTENSDGLEYRLESVIPIFTAEELRGAQPVRDAEFVARYTELPADLTPIVESEAQRITGGQSNDYDRMLALQAFFQEFDYSLELSRREGDPIEQFLAERIGFCQQFSGTFALMARSLGLPARVAVGFTWGDPVEGEENTYRVTGRHTHAWPEVYFEGLGWVAFEPTPGRGAPDAAHTGLTPAQDSETQPDVASTPATVPGETAAPDPTILDDLLIEPDLGTGETPSTVDDAGVSIPWRLVGPLLALVAYGVAMPMLVRLRRARRLAGATTPAAEIEAIWSNLAEHLSWFLRVDRRADQTRTEWVERLIRDRRLPADELRRLGATATRARFAPSQFIDESEATTARLDAAVVDALIYERTPLWRRWLTMLDPRNLLRRPGRSVAV